MLSDNSAVSSSVKEDVFAASMVVFLQFQTSHDSRLKKGESLLGLVKTLQQRFQKLILTDNERCKLSEVEVQKFIC